MSSHDQGLRRAVRLVALLNFAYFGVEFAVALAIGSVSLFADSVDFLEDTSVNFLILAALGWSARRRAKVGMALAGILLIPGLGALAVNLSCALMLTRFRRHSGSLTKAAFLSARNDALANIAIIAAGLLTAYTLSAWPDLVVGLGIAAINADAAREVWQAARQEHRAAKA
ncbi:cation transporter [Nitratireductor rhodophyticola]|uniref:cation transporter n=1 Tax=Nitratireductor rhodophyticola TaxID=2854036 RepID=UPI003AB891EB